VYSDRTRGDLQVAKNNFFCSASFVGKSFFFLKKKRIN
jgi:hypothetical protein